MRCLLAFLALVILPLTASAGVVSIRPSTESGRGRFDIEARSVTIFELTERLELYLARVVEVDRAVANRRVSFRSVKVTPMQILKDLASRERLDLEEVNGVFVVRDSKEPRVTLDVKDREIRDILASMKTQCRIRNLIVDPGVKGSGTFLFNDVPCSVAFKIVFASAGLASDVEPNSVIGVSRRD